VVLQTQAVISKDGHHGMELLFRVGETKKKESHVYLHIEQLPQFATLAASPTSSRISYAILFWSPSRHHPAHLTQMSRAL